MGLFTYRSIQELVDDSAWVSHTHEVLETLSDTLALLTDAESGQRGYVITGEIQYLEPYHGVLPQIEASLRRLEALVADNPEQQERARRVAGLVRERVQLMQRTVAARGEGFAAAQRLIGTEEGLRLTDAIRTALDEMEAHERSLLARRGAQARQAARGAEAVAGGGLLLALLIMAAMLLAIRAESRRREAVEARLQDSNQDLARSLDHVQRLGGEQTAMSSMADLLQSCRTLDEARPIIVRTLSQLFPRESVAVSLLNASQNLMDTIIEWVPEGAASGTQGVFAPDQCWALRRGRMHDVPDGASGQLCGHLAGPPPPAYVCLPMMAQGETLGALFVRRPSAGALGDEQRRLVRTVSEQLALALANLKLQETLRHQSIRDPLTGLFNRRYMEASMEREFARAKRGGHGVCVLMTDVDHFKRFNDTFGHEAGDAVLAEFAGVLKASSREDDIACRYGGEEFALILPETTVAQARERAEQIRLATRKLHLEHRRRSLGTITVSIGVAMYPQDGSSISAVIQAADAALYQAKQAGRDRVLVAGEAAPQSST